MVVVVVVRGVDVGVGVVVVVVKLTGLALRPIGVRGDGADRDRGAVPNLCSYLVLVEPVTLLEKEESLRQS